MARGRSPSMAMVLTGARVSGLITNTALLREHDTHARRGVPANTRSLGPAGVSSVATTASEAKSTMLMLDEMWLTTHSSLDEANRTVTGSTPTATLPLGRGTPD